MAQTATPYGSTTVPSANQIPRFVSFTSPVSAPTPSTGTFGGATLPLNLIAHIVALLDDLGDIARVTRTCRLLYYMTLPQLYTRVSLRSYSSIQYRDGRPEGFGAGSPFMMALNGLVTKPHTNMIKEFGVRGEWNEVGADDFAKGRVPDNSMMLNILLRAATDRMTRLHAFRWELDCKPLKTLYQGLAAHETLTELTIKFPSTRIPRPAVIIPPMANLKSFRAMEIDPLCYPDDISVLLLSSKKLVDLRLHFSPRMRQEAESSLSWQNYFGRCLRANYKMALKHFAVQNFYGSNLEGLHECWDENTCKSIVFLDFFGGAKGASANVFLDDTWKNIPDCMRAKTRYVRSNEPATQHVHLLRTAEEKVEKMYLVSARRSHTGVTPNSDNALPVTPDEPHPEVQTVELAKSYIHAITRFHGKSLKHLLLPDYWHLSPEELGDLVRYCSNLEQLGIGINSEDTLRTLHLLLPFLPELKALRLLLSDDVAGRCTAGDHWGELSIMLAKLRPNKLKWMGVGQHLFKLGGCYEVISDKGEVEPVVDITAVKYEDVAHVEIWKLDCLDIMVDDAPT